MDTLQNMRAFIAVVETGTFTAAAGKMRLSKGIVSKQIGQLESSLGIRLLNRTTRSVKMTDFGQTYYERASRIIQDVDDLERSASESLAIPHGLLRISVPQAFGQIYIIPMLADFLEAYPKIEVDVNLTDRFVALVEEGIDVAIRITQPEDSSLIARRIMDMRVPTVAAPAYLEAHGMPSAPQELRSHSCVLDTNVRPHRNWRFLSENAESYHVPVSGKISTNSPVATRQMVLRGFGIARIPSFLVEEDIARGELVELFKGQNPTGGAVYAVFPHAGLLGKNVRSFIDFAVKWFKESQARQGIPRP